MRPYVMNNELLAGALSDLRCELKGKIDDEQNELLYECISRIFSRTDVELERNRLKQELKSAEEIAGRMNALESERDALREALRKSFLALGGVAPADVLSEFLCTVPEEVALKVQALEAERDAMREELEQATRNWNKLYDDYEFMCAKVRELTDDNVEQEKAGAELSNLAVALGKKIDDLEAERDDYRTALANRNNELDAVVKERDRYVAALEQIELMDPDWTLGVDENMSRLQSIAGRALKGGGDE